MFTLQNNFDEFSRGYIFQLIHVKSANLAYSTSYIKLEKPCRICMFFVVNSTSDVGVSDIGCGGIDLICCNVVGFIFYCNTPAKVEQLPQHNQLFEQ